MAAKYDKTIVGWDEIIDRVLDDKAVGMVIQTAPEITNTATAKYRTPWEFVHMLLRESHP